jgi:hypothetical protein
MKRCKSCKQSVPDNVKTCPFCGKSIGGFWSRLFGGNDMPQPPGFSSSVAQPPGSSTSVAQDAGPFAMTIEDVFSIGGRGTVVTGLIRGGEIKVGDQVRFVTPSNQEKVCIVTGVEIFRKLKATAKAGDYVGLLLKGADQEDVAKGIELHKAGS